MRSSAVFLVFLWFGTVAAPAAEPTAAAVWTNNLDASQASLARDLARTFQTAGYHVTFLDNAALTNPSRLDPDRFGLLVLPDAQSLPLEAVGPLEHFLHAGRDLVALGLPAWQHPLFHHAGRWFTQADFDHALGAVKLDHLVAEFGPADVARWERASNTPQSPAQRQSQPTDAGAALHVIIDNLSGWDTLVGPMLDRPFPTGHTLTCFRAKGGPRTTQLALEWRETDGSRWIATVDLSTNWQSYVLTPEQFRPWEPPSARGGPGDHLHVENANRFTVGLALTHTAVRPGRHEYWLANLGTAASPFGDFAPPTTLNLPPLETLSPSYQCYSLNDSTLALALSPGEREPPAGLLEHSKVPVAIAARRDSEWIGVTNALQPRPRGVGFDQRRPWRWQPLLEARARDGDYRGAIAALLVHTRPPCRGGVWASFTPSNPAFYRQPAIQQLLRQLATRLRRGLFLIEGGAEFFTVFDDQPVRLGARVANFGSGRGTNLTVRLTVSNPATRQVAFTQSWDLPLASGVQQTVEHTWRPDRWPPGGFQVTTELRYGSRIIDRLEHELNVWRPKATPYFIEARDGGLWLRGKPWKAHGVNYMPSSGIGVTGDYFEFWLDRGAYDPVVIERDLERIRGMGLNAVSVFVYHRELEAQHLLDFLRRCEALGLHVNQSLRPGTPLDFHWSQIKELIEFFRLAQNDTIFAYDLAWEPSHYGHAQQEQTYQAAWQSWVLKRYGNLPAAARAWDTPAPTANGELAVPPMSQLTRDGPWRKLAADYRAFLDQLLGQKYAMARRLVKAIDPHHAVSFRMQLAGDPTFDDPGLLPYDFCGLADAVDVWEPEAYGRIGDWDRVKAGEFTAAYARLCDPTKPLVWAEMGYNVWDLNRMAPNPEKLAFGKQFYHDFYRMLRESGADGVFFWWYPGGFRVNEQSDFGIINPDGTDRTITQVIRAEGPRFLAAPKPPAPNCVIKIDRDRDARGLFGVYTKVRRDYWQAVAEGKTPRLAWTRRPDSGRE